MENEFAISVSSAISAKFAGLIYMDDVPELPDRIWPRANHAR